MSKLISRKVHMPLVLDWQEERPFIAVSVLVEGDVWSTLTMGRRSGHPFTTKRVMQGQADGSSCALMALFAGLSMLNPPLAHRFEDVLEFLDQLNEEEVEGSEDVPF